MAEFLAEGPMGCVIPDQGTKEQIWASLPFESLMQAAPEFLSADDDADVFFFDAEAKYLKTLFESGTEIPWKVTRVQTPDGEVIYLLNHKQTQSDCTSHGASGAMEDEQMVDIVWRGTAAEFHPIASEPLYGGAVVTIMQSHGDRGAFTSAPLQYASQYGFLKRGAYGQWDLTNYNSQAVLNFCQHGVPSDLVTAENSFKLQTMLPVHSYDEGSALMRQGYSISLGSNQGFSLTRDSDGFCRPQGHWAHCTRMRGRRGGKKPGWAYGQSWGAGMPSGPNIVTLDSGRSLALPEGTFFIDPDTVNRMIGQGECYAVSKLAMFVTLDYKMF